jgi:hypothetical protein
VLEIVLSLLLGAAVGWIFTFTIRFFHSNSKRLCVSVAFVMLTFAFSMLKFEVSGVKIGFSSLLVCMMLGSVFCNLCPLSEEIMRVADRWTAPVLVLFFVLSGAELELGVFAKAGSVAIGVVYILPRSLGKYIGARESARLMGCDKTVVDYLGITLLPQAGVALGMCVTVAQLPGDGTLVRNIVLFAVLNYELFGPVMTKWALTKAGDIQPKSEEVVNRRRSKIAKAPQGFRLDEVLDVQEKAISEGVTDMIDTCTLMRHYGHSLSVVDCGADNVKITTPEDFFMFRAVADARENDQLL